MELLCDVLIPPDDPLLAITTVEGGRWVKVNKLSNTELYILLRQGVHSLILKSGKRWDCINGWNSYV